MPIGQGDLDGDEAAGHSREKVVRKLRYANCLRRRSSRESRRKTRARRHFARLPPTRLERLRRVSTDAPPALGTQNGQYRLNLKTDSIWQRQPTLDHVCQVIDYDSYGSG
jgi:hypothetical protein